jgi:hypothetical protein
MAKYADLQAMWSQGYEEARKLGYTSVDLASVEREIAAHDRLARHTEKGRRASVRRVQQANAWAAQCRARS